MQLQALMNIFEESAPRALAEAWDNPGLLIEPEQTDITRILVSLDCTTAIVHEAVEKGAQLVLTHHPLFFNPVRRLYHSEPETAAAYALVRHGIGLFAAHTNLDSAHAGVNDALAAAIGLRDVCALCAPALLVEEPMYGIGRVGMLDSPMLLVDFAAFVRDRLHTAVRMGGDAKHMVQRVAVVGGSGGSMLRDAKEARADVLLTGEVKHDQALAAAVYGLGIVEAGHYETECIVLDPWIRGLQSALKKVQYKVDVMRAEAECSPLVAP